MIRVYGMQASGNCYKVQLLMAQLGIAHDWVETDLFQGATRTTEYLAKNPNGKVPLLELQDGRVLAESNAILAFLASGSAMLPEEPWRRALVLQWMFFEQYSHEPYIAVARFIMKFLPADHPRRAELPRLHERGHQALSVMERHLASRSWFANEAYSIADIALFAYTHDAASGGFELSAYPNLTAWLQRMRAQPGFIAQRS